MGTRFRSKLSLLPTLLPKGYRSRSLSLAVILVGLFVGFVLVGQRQIFRKKAAATAVLSFSSSAFSIAPGNQFIVGVNLNTGGQAIVGADILVKFDPTRLALVSMSNNPTNNTNFKTYAPVTSTGTFDTARVVNCTNNGVATGCPSGVGVVEFGITAFDWANNALTTAYTGTLLVSNLTFKVISCPPGQTSCTAPLSFVYTNGLTTDSNVVVNAAGSTTPEDILSSTSTSTVTITGSNDACLSDVTVDGLVDLRDYGQLASNWLSTNPSPPRADINRDGLVDIRDYGLLASKWLGTCP
ncbi:hypothetical protein A2627_03975 [Candidatus Woesebacteria bacterium RIFCSPHIGHO2_01_FULL_39_28]|uniref:Cohesin domain-containing protein n=1 Tax=Candidatus Woesebacteria bacterium RIFCSPHIGHO2_01_FULL_39_28 TaxID=1802496 RepID=A0A1F7YG81_9BACT|nr:MAG: hypothetical protein A2627_03975 [Candidatus Woesebacteria bacterium RIFCSPHIGHO2_01_FULL_39_28]OGM57248.1 MAG: hypothetical protein A3A50_00535 [Candidatus Woesebacteria bacterium RIFCSPLOWO2_01_FULL_38_20]